MYDYRKMTDDEKKQVLDFRKQRKYPFHRPPHLNLGKGVYLITAATFEHIYYFNEPDELSTLEYSIIEALNNARISYYSWVIQPNHYHLLLNLGNPKDFGNVIAPVHRKSALYCNKRDNVFNRKVWYRYADRKMRSERHFWATVSYLLFNPVKHGFTDKPEDWLWSNYEDLAKEQFKKIKNEYPLKDYGKGWDDY